MRKYLRNYIEENIKIIKIIVTCIGIGLIAGIIIFSIIDEGTKNEFLRTTKNTLELSKNDNFESVNIIRNGIIANGILLFVVYFCSITLVAPLLISAITFLKGFSIGLYISTLFSIFGVSKGLLVTILLVGIPNLIYFPSFIFSTINAIKLHYFLFEEKNESVIFKVSKEFIYILVAYSVIILSVIIEQLVSGKVIEIYNLL